jgi:hypothetical protein
VQIKRRYARVDELGALSGARKFLDGLGGFYRLWEFG